MKTPFLPGLRAQVAPMGSRSTPAVHPCRQATLGQIEARLGRCVPAALLQRQAGKEFSRERIYTLPRTFWCWIWQIFQANTSCREVVRQVQALFTLREAGRVGADTAGYCLARGKLGLAWLEEVFASSVASCQKSAAPRGLLQGRPLRAVDGSGSRLPDTPRNREAYPPNHKVSGAGFPFLRFTTLFCLASGAILARALGSLRSQERQHLLSFRAALHKGDILLGDRAFGCFVFLAVLQSWGVDLLARVATLNRRVDYRRAGKKLGPQDALFTWKKGRGSKLLPAEEWAALPEEITVRIIRHRVAQKGFRTKEVVLVTTLLDPAKYPREEILEAYLLRWRMEMCLDDIKTSLGMEMLTCRSPEMVEKELLMFLIAHNFVRWLMLQAAEQNAPALARISFKGTLDAFRQWSHALAQLGPRARSQRQRDKLWRRLLETLRQDPVPERPGRPEPRAVKNRPKYDWLNKPRGSYQERPSRNERRRISRAKKRASLN